MSALIDTCDDCITCLCGNRWCMAETVSPGEAAGLCVECAERAA
jgi:hypothetical protein